MTKLQKGLAVSNPIVNFTSKNILMFNGNLNNSSTIGDKLMSTIQVMGNVMFPNNQQRFVLTMPKAKQSVNNSISYSCEQQEIIFGDSPMTFISCKPKRKHSDNELLAFLNCNGTNATSSCRSKYDTQEYLDEWDEDDESTESDDEPTEVDLNDEFIDTDGNRYILVPVEEEEEDDEEDEE